MKRLERLYEIKNDLLNIYRLNPNLDSLEEVKREYIKNAEGKNLFYEITSRNARSWQTDGIYIPYSKLDNVGLRVGKKREETVLRPLTEIPARKMNLIDVYCKSDLGSSAEPKMVFDGKINNIRHYFLFLSSHYTGSEDRLQYYDNILELNKKLFMFELLIHGYYAYVDIEAYNDIRDFFSVDYIDCIPTKALFELDEDVRRTIIDRETITHKLIQKIING